MNARQAIKGFSIVLCAVVGLLAMVDSAWAYNITVIGPSVYDADTAVMDATPSSLSSTMILFVRTAGGVTSLTVTVAVSVALLPFSSVTVSVTSFSPTCSHAKSVLSTLRLATPHASDEPLSICAAVMDATTAMAATRC